MGNLPKNVRLLYLLALLQLLGGPAVLCGILVVAKLGQQSEAKPLTEQIVSVIEEVQHFYETGYSNELPPPDPAKAPAPVKVKESKFKLNGTLTQTVCVITEPGALLLVMPMHRDPPPVSQAQAPPLPPPRLA